MRYIPRPGIVLTKLCNMYVLIPTRTAFDYCHTVQKLPTLWAAAWEFLFQPNAEERILQLHRVFSNKSEEELKAQLDVFYSELTKKGFLIQEADDT